MPRSKSRPSPGAPALKRSVSDLRALAHPLRLRMMELFAESPKTTKQVAELLGQPPTRLYHHVAALERAGLLVLQATRQNRGAVEKWYVGVGRQLRADEKSGKRTAEGRRTRRAIAATVMEQARQEMLATRREDEQAALLARVVIAASPAKIPEIRKRLYDAIQSLRTDFENPEKETPAEDCERWAVTLAFAPVRAPASRR